MSKLEHDGDVMFADKNTAVRSNQGKTGGCEGGTEETSGGYCTQ